MIEVLKQTADIFMKYSGSSLYMTIFLCGLVYLWITEEDKGKKAVLVYCSACVLFLFFFPLCSYFLINIIFDHEIYYRMLWFLPVSIVIAYAATKLVALQTKMVRKVVITLLTCVILIRGGDYTYDNPTFVKAENAYHIPQEVIDVCDVMIPEDESQWVMAVVPQEMISYVRQYSANIHMPYGREVLIERWNLWHPMYQTMEADTVWAKTLAQQAHQAGCQYIVLQEDKVFDESIENWGYILQKNVDGYNIYLDKSEELGIELDDD